MWPRRARSSYWPARSSSRRCRSGSRSTRSAPSGAASRSCVSCARPATPRCRPCSSKTEQRCCRSWWPRRGWPWRSSPAAPSGMPPPRPPSGSSSSRWPRSWRTRTTRCCSASRRRPSRNTRSARAWPPTPQCATSSRFTRCTSAPTLLSVTDTRGFEARHDLTNPELPQRGGGVLPSNTIAIRRERLIRGDVVNELLSFHNYGAGPARLTVSLDFRARFEDIFVIKRFVRGPRGRVRRPRLRGDAVELAYDARDGTRCTTVLAFSPAPDRLTGRRAEFVCALAAGERREIGISITPCVEREQHREPGRPGTPPTRVRRWLERLDQLWLARAAEVRSSNPLFDRVMLRALLDLRLLRASLHGRQFFCAGVPWFSTLFGRDAATVAIQTLPFGSATAGHTLRLLARYQANAIDAYRDAEPGKILHELRTGELARLGAIPQSPAYYGSVDATLLFLILVAEYVAWSGDLALARALRPNVDAALDWIDRFADHNGDGYVDYTGRYAHGLVNQGWK